MPGGLILCIRNHKNIHSTVLYFTGSADFNENENELLERGYTLNEYGVKDLVDKDKKFCRKFKKKKASSITSDMIMLNLGIANIQSLNL